MTTERETSDSGLTDAQIAVLMPRGRRRRVAAGEVLWEEGARGSGFYVVLSGELEVVDLTGDTPRQVAVHLPGDFSGDVDMLTGRANLVRGVMRTDGEVLELDGESLRRVVRELPEISEVLVRAFLVRRSTLLHMGFRGIQIIGSRFSPRTHHLRDFCTRNGIAYTWIDVEQDPQAEELLRGLGVGPEDTPVVIGRDGRWRSNPEVGELAAYMGLVVPIDDGELFDLVVVGAGPAGLGAAVYASSEGLRVLVVEGTGVGGRPAPARASRTTWAFPWGSRARSWRATPSSRRRSSARASRCRAARWSCA